MRMFTGGVPRFLGKAAHIARHGAEETGYGIAFDIHAMQDGAVVVEFHDEDHECVLIDVDELVLDALWFLEAGG